MSVARELADYLASLPQVESAKPVQVTIGKNTYFGALYVETHEAQPTERVVQEGPIEAGETLRTHCLYLLGKRPKLRRKNNVFVCDLKIDSERCYESSDEWYIAGWYEGGISDVQRWGNNVLIRHNKPMNFGYYKGWKIDTGDRYAPYPRIPMTIDPLEA